MIRYLRGCRIFRVMQTVLHERVFDLVSRSWKTGSSSYVGYVSAFCRILTIFPSYCTNISVQTWHKFDRCDSGSGIGLILWAASSQLASSELNFLCHLGVPNGFPNPVLYVFLFPPPFQDQNKCLYNILMSCIPVTLIRVDLICGLQSGVLIPPEVHENIVLSL
jgi:hypothetical protein